MKEDKEERLEKLERVIKEFIEADDNLCPGDAPPVWMLRDVMEEKA